MHSTDSLGPFSHQIDMTAGRSHGPEIKANMNQMDPTNIGNESVASDPSGPEDLKPSNAQAHFQEHNMRKRLSTAAPAGSNQMAVPQDSRPSINLQNDTLELSTHNRQGDMNSKRGIDTSMMRKLSQEEDSVASEAWEDEKSNDN